MILRRHPICMTKPLNNTKWIKLPTPANDIRIEGTTFYLSRENLEIAFRMVQRNVTGISGLRFNRVFDLLGLIF